MDEIILLIGSILEGVGFPYPVGIQLVLLGYWRGDTTQSALRFWGLFVMSNSLGAAVAYHLGRRFWRRGTVARILRFARLFRPKEGTWKRAKRYVREYGVYSILGVFVLSRTIRIPLMYIAGVANMPFGWYFLCAVVGNAVWGGIWLSLGILWASNKDRYLTFMEAYRTMVVFAVVAMVAAGCIYLFMHRIPQIDHRRKRR